MAGFKDLDGYQIEIVKQHLNQNTERRIKIYQSTEKSVK